MADTRDEGLGTDATSERDRARARVARKHKLRADLVAYLVVNAALVVAWAVTGFGDFWPGWVLGIWGVFLVLDAVNLYERRSVTEEEVDDELRRRGR